MIVVIAVATGLLNFTTAALGKQMDCATPQKDLGDKLTMEAEGYQLQCVTIADAFFLKLCVRLTSLEQDSPSRRRPL